MKIILEKFYYFEAPFKAQISKYKTTVSPQLIVLLNFEGIQGFGSAPVHHAKGYDIYQFYHKTIQQYLENLDFKTFKEYREKVSIDLLYPESAVAYAFDQALWDLEGKTENHNVAYLLESDHKKEVRITEQLFIADLDSNIKLLQKMIERGTSRIKIKTGKSIKEDIHYLQQLRKYCGEKIEFQIDANSAYTLSEAISNEKVFKDLGVVMWEDPLKSDDFNQYAELRENTSIPVMLDRSIMTDKDLRIAIEKNAIDILNFKLSRIGGLTNALKLKNICEENKVRISVGCAEDLGASTSTIMIFSSIVKDLFATEGVGSYRLNFDITNHEFLIIKGKLQLPSGKGLGIDFHEQHLNEAAKEKRFQVYDFSLGQGKKSLLMKKYLNKIKKAPKHYYKKFTV